MGVELVFGRRVAVEFEGFGGAGDALAEAVGVTEDAGGLGDDGIAVAGGEGKCLSGGIAIEAAGVVDRDVVREAVETDGGGGLVIAVDDGIEQEFAEGDAGVVVDHGFDEAAVHGHRALAEVGIDDQIEGLEQGAEVAEGALFIKDFAGEAGAGVTDELHIGSGEVMHGTVGEDDDAGIRRAVLPEIEKAEAGELLFERASVFGDDFLGDGMAEVGEAEAFFGKVGEGAIETREGIEGEGVGDAALGEDAFFLLAGSGPARTDPEIDPAFVADGGEIGGEDLHHGHVARWQRETSDGEGGHGLDVAIGAQGTKRLEEVIGDL